MSAKSVFNPLSPLPCPNCSPRRQLKILTLVLIVGGTCMKSNFLRRDNLRYGQNFQTVLAINSFPDTMNSGNLDLLHLAYVGMLFCQGIL